jgi:peroxiredoxin
MGHKKANATLSMIAVVASLLFFDIQAFGFRTPQNGDALPDISIPVPPNEVEKNYLGIKGGKFFHIPQIKAEVVIMEIFSMYCPYCQREAPEVNRLYTLIENNPELRGKVKLIGLGAGNTRFEVEVFKKNYKVPFPLFADKDFRFHEAFGEVRTPYFIGVKINPDQSHQVFYSRLGGFGRAEEFLDLVLRVSGLGKGDMQ